MYQDDCRLKGVVNLVLRDKNGKVKQHKTVRNKVTRYGIAHIIGRMVDDSQDKDGGHQMPPNDEPYGNRNRCCSSWRSYNAIMRPTTMILQLKQAPTNLTATSRKRAVAASTIVCFKTKEVFVFK